MECHSILKFVTTKRPRSPPLPFVSSILSNRSIIFSPNFNRISLFSRKAIYFKRAYYLISCKTYENGISKRTSLSSHVRAMFSDLFVTKVK